MTQPQDILDFWFQGVTDETLINKKSSPFSQWFNKNESFDQNIRERFEEDFKKAVGGQYQDWANSAKGLLALIILCDQFSRNMYRNSPQMFAGDSLALKLTLEAIQNGTDEQFSLIERTFLYMPLMHAEDLGVQNMSLECFSELIEECKVKNPRNVSYYEYSFDYAKRHQAIIERFGRFPHRNITLKRESTALELAFLKKPGSSF